MQFSRDGSKSKLLMFVYSLTSGLWNKLKVVRDAKYLVVFKTGQLANDALHWLLFQGCMHEMQCILHFNLVDETINEIPLPNREFSYGLFISGGCLHTWRKIEERIEALILKEYGMGESWTKMVRA
ncbi:hypothetical protein Droror1_Dr00002602 [Drosera rotundifolia]